MTTTTPGASSDAAAEIYESPGSHLAAYLAAAARLARQLAEAGITRVYTATCDRYALISVTAGLTVWTNGRVLWWHHPDQPGTWPAADPAPAAGRLAAIAAHPHAGEQTRAVRGPW